MSLFVCLFVFRGPPKQVQVVADQYSRQSEVTVQTLPYKDGTITKVDLYKVVDQKKFKTATENQSHSVKFAKARTIQEYDAFSGKLRQKMTEVTSPPPSPKEADDKSSSSESEESGSVRSSSSSSSSSASDSESDISSQSPTERSPKKKKMESRRRQKRPTSITQEILSQAKDIKVEVDDTKPDGNGPKSND